MYYVNEENGYILSVQKGGAGGREITEAEYAAIQGAIAAKPERPAGYGYRLKTDLTWELYELPPEPEPDPDAEITDSEALSIILGGDSA